MTKFRKQKFKPESAPKLFRVAQDDLYSAEVLFTAPKYRPENVLYHIQQSIEKTLKAVLIFKGIAVPLTHDLDVLTAELSDSTDTTSLPQGMGELTQFATIRRYLDGDEILEKRDIEESIQAAKQAIAWAKKILNQ